MLGTIICIVAVISFIGLSFYLCRTPDRRMDYMERERTKRDLDFIRWM